MIFCRCVYIGRMEHRKTRKDRAGTRGARVQRLYNPCKNTKGALSFKVPKRGGRKSNSPDAFFFAPAGGPVPAAGLLFQRALSL